jgi:hypothetical protein
MRPTQPVESSTNGRCERRTKIDCASKALTLFDAARDRMATKRRTSRRFIAK